MSDKWNHRQPHAEGWPEAWIADNIAGMGPRNPMKFGYREFDGQVFCEEHARARPELSPQEMGKVIAAAGIPLRGWDDVRDAETIGEWIGLGTDDWSRLRWKLESLTFGAGEPIPKHPGQPISADEVGQVLTNVLTKFSRLHDGLGRKTFADKKTQDALRQLATIFKNARIKLVGAEIQISVTNKYMYQQIETLRNECERWSDRFWFLGGSVRKTTKQPQILNLIIEVLASAFQTLFDQSASGGWKPKTPEPDNNCEDADASMVADSPFIRFAKAFFDAVGYDVARSTIQRKYY